MVNKVSNAGNLYILLGDQCNFTLSLQQASLLPENDHDVDKMVER